MDELYFTVLACIAGPFHTTSICKYRYERLHHQTQSAKIAMSNLTVLGTMETAITTTMLIEMDQAATMVRTKQTDDDTGDQNCWGKVTSSLTKNDDGRPGIGEHSE